MTRKHNGTGLVAERRQNHSEAERQQTRNTASHHPQTPHPRSGRLTKGPHMPIGNLENPGAAPKGERCETCKALDDLPTEEAAALGRLLADPTWQYTRLSEALKGEGLSLAPGQLSRHARGRCLAGVKLR